MIPRETLKEVLRRASETGASETGAGETGPDAIEDLVRRHAAAAVASLAAVLEDETATPASRIAAATALLQWGYGRPGPQPKGKPGEGAEQNVRLTWGGAPEE